MSVRIGDLLIALLNVVAVAVHVTRFSAGQFDSLGLVVTVTCSFGAGFYGAAALYEKD